MEEEDPLESLDGEIHTGIIAGLPVFVIEDEEDGIWIAPGNWAVGLFLSPYLESWFYNDDSPVFLYEGTYWDGLFEWAFMAKYEGDK